MSTVERVRAGRPRLDLDGGPAHRLDGGPAHRPRLDPSLFPAELRRGRGGGGGRRGWEEAADGRVGGHGGGGVVGGGGGGGHGGGPRGWEEAGGDTSARGRGGRRGWREERCSYTRWAFKSTLGYQQCDLDLDVQRDGGEGRLHQPRPLGRRLCAPTSGTF